MSCYHVHGHRDGEDGEVHENQDGPHDGVHERRRGSSPNLYPGDEAQQNSVLASFVFELQESVVNLRAQNLDLMQTNSAILSRLTAVEGQLALLGAHANSAPQFVVPHNRSDRNAVGVGDIRRQAIAEFAHCQAPFCGHEALAERKLTISFHFCDKAQQKTSASFTLECCMLPDDRGISCQRLKKPANFAAIQQAATACGITPKTRSHEQIVVEGVSDSRSKAGATTVASAATASTAAASSTRKRSYPVAIGRSDATAKADGDVGAEPE